MTRRSLPLCGLLCIALLGSCEESVSSGDGGTSTNNKRTPKCTNGVDKWVDIDTAMDLKAGEESAVQDYICPVGDKDYFKVTVAPGHKLLRINLTHAAKISNVKLSYLVLDKDSKTVAKAPPSEDGRAYDVLHCLAPGDYYVLVQDEGNDGQDGTNPYKISFSSEADPDSAEGSGNNDFDTAVALSGSVSGYISCTEDADFYSITVGTDQLLEVKVTTAGQTPVDIKYSIYDDKQEWVADQVNPDGFKGAADLTTLHAMPKAGKYFIKVEDNNNDEADPKTAYTLSATTKAEQDANDKGTRNDTPATATSLGSGPTLDKTVTGQIASKADVDYYKVDGLAGISVNNPAVIEVSVTYGGPAEVEPTIALIYGDPDSPCTKDACCRVLNPTGPGCTNMINCSSSSFSCISKGDTFCSDADCAPGAGTSCPVERRCAGAAVCLPTGSCGAEQVVRFHDGDSKTDAALKTAQPLVHPGPWYIRVTDHQNDEYLHGKNYTMQVRVRMDPDGTKEINSSYFPVLVSTSLKTAVRKINVAAAEAKNTPLTLPFTLNGYISYEGDKDWFLMPNPCPGEECTMQASFRSTGSGCPTGAGNDGGLEFVYEVLNKNGEPKDRFPANPTVGQTGTFGGNARCWLARNSNNYIFTVSDWGHNNWSWSCGYQITVSIHHNGCPTPPCDVYENKCYVP